MLDDVHPIAFQVATVQVQEQSFIQKKAKQPYFVSLRVGHKKLGNPLMNIIYSIKEPGNISPILTNHCQGGSNTP